jgi:hypothetical protein
LNDSDRGEPPGWGHGPEKDKTSEPSFQRSPDEHSRSSKVVSRYNVMAVDGEIGHFEDGIVDDQTWSIENVVANVRHWWPGKKVALRARSPLRS